MCGLRFFIPLRRHKFSNFTLLVIYFLGERHDVNTLKGVPDIGHWNKKLCQAQNVPGLVFALIASHLLVFIHEAAGVGSCIHVAWAPHWRLSWHSLWCWCWRLFSPIQRVSIVLAFARACVLLAFM